MERPHATRHAARQRTPSSVSVLRHHPTSQGACVHRAAVSSMPRRARGCTAEASTLAAVVHRWQGSRPRPWSASRPRATQHRSARHHLCSCCGAVQRATTHGSSCRQQHAPRHARERTAEGGTLTAVHHRWQHSRARPWSASTPRGTQRIRRPGHPSPRPGAVQPATTRASRGREQRAEVCT